MSTQTDTQSFIKAVTCDLTELNLVGHVLFWYLDSRFKIALTPGNIQVIFSVR